MLEIEQPLLSSFIYAPQQDPLPPLLSQTSTSHNYSRRKRHKGQSTNHKSLVIESAREQHLFANYLCLCFVFRYHLLLSVSVNVNWLPRAAACSVIRKFFISSWITHTNAPCLLTFSLPGSRILESFLMYHLLPSRVLMCTSLVRIQ